MTKVLSVPLPWLGGRSVAELADSDAGSASTAALVGLAMLMSAMLTMLGWRTWLGQTSLAHWAIPCAICLALLALLFFRQLSRGMETAHSLPRRTALGTLATLALLPGAWLASIGLPPQLFPRQLAEHQQAVARVRDAADADAQAQQKQIKRMQQNATKSQLDFGRLSQAVPPWQAAITTAKGRASRCLAQLETLKLALPEDTETSQYQSQLRKVHVRSVRCADAQANVDDIRARFNARVEQPLTQARSAMQASQSALQAGEARFAATLAAQRETLATLQPACSALPVCKLQHAMATSHLRAWEVWGLTLLIMFGALLPAVLRACLPADAVARQRRLAADEDALLDRAWQASQHQVSTVLH